MIKYNSKKGGGAGLLSQNICLELRSEQLDHIVLLFLSCRPVIPALSRHLLQLNWTARYGVEAIGNISNQRPRRQTRYYLILSKYFYLNITM